MPEVTEGLENGDPSEHNLDSDAGFNAHMAEKIAEKTGEPVSERAQAAIDALKDSDRSVDSGLTFNEESARQKARDAVGRFTEAAADDTTTEERAAPAEEREEDPLAAFIEQHGGDPRAALAAALKETENAQTLLGRHSQEVGEARQRETELLERVAKLEGRVEATPQPTPQTLDLNVVEERIAQNSEYGDAAFGYAAQLVANDQAEPELIDEVLDIWEDYAPREARKARRFWQAQQAAAVAEDEGAPQTDPRLAKIVSERQFNESLDSARATVDLADTAKWNVVKPFVNEVLEGARPRVLNMINSSDPDEQRDGLEIILDSAKERAIAKATASVREEATASTTAAKKAASVATGSLRPAPERQPESDEDFETRREAAIAKFKQQIMEAPSTSVMDNIEYSSK